MYGISYMKTVHSILLLRKKVTFAILNSHYWNKCSWWIWLKRETELNGLKIWNWNCLWIGTWSFTVKNMYRFTSCVQCVCSYRERKYLSRSSDDTVPLKRWFYQCHIKHLLNTYLADSIPLWISIIRYFD